MRKDESAFAKIKREDQVLQVLSSSSCFFSFPCAVWLGQGL